ncbi:MAG: response regulator [Cellulosilyticaceae bacterium]
MYKIALIDDEMIVREGMKELIPWQELGLELIGTAEDGVAGYALIEEKKPDIVLLDINMPKCDGIELAKRVKEVYTHIKIVFISGYDEFDYARQAVRIGVEDYILKPITKVEIKNLLGKIVRQLDHEKAEQEKVLLAQSTVEKSLGLVQQKVMQELLMNQIQHNMIEKKCKKVNIPCHCPAYGVFFVDPDERLDGGEKTKSITLTSFVVQNIVREVLEHKKWGIAFEVEGVTGVFYTSQATEWISQQETYDQHMHVIQKAIQQSVGIQVSIGVGNLVTRIQDVYQSYDEAKSVLKSRFLKGTGQIIYYQHTVYQKADVQRLLEWEERMLEALVDRETFCRAIQHIELEMKREKVVVEDIQQIWGHILYGVVKKLSEQNKQIILEVSGGIDMAKEIQQCKTFSQMQQFIIDLYDQYRTSIVEDINPTQIYVDSIKSFIKENYTDPELSVKHICDHIHISASYVGQIFKKEMGKTFIQYVTAYRIEKAKELLTYTNLKTYEITEKVGYVDAHYFSVIFKKYTRVTPSEYRKRTRHE